MPKKIVKVPTAALALPLELIERRIYVVRDHKVMLDRDLAELYEVPTKVFNQAVKRNRQRFPKDFMFQLMNKEAGPLRSQIVTLKKARGRHAKYAPYAFTEQGVAMLASILNSSRAIQVNITIMRAFVRMREIMSTHRDLLQKINGMEKKYDDQFHGVFIATRKLMEPPVAPKRRIGFTNLSKLQ
jgi:hypothetical protein